MSPFVAALEPPPANGAAHKVHHTANADECAICKTEKTNNPGKTVSVVQKNENVSDSFLLFFDKTRTENETLNIGPVHITNYSCPLFKFSNTAIFGNGKLFSIGDTY